MEAIVATIYGLGCAAWGAVACFAVLNHKGWIKKPHPFRWKCLEEGCNFSCSGSEAGTVDRMITRHKEAVHG
jgi:hypothetical protein